MITNIKRLENIGTFSSDSGVAKLDFKRIVLIYGDNGRGKTTLAAILHSLMSNDPEPIIGRHRLGATEPPHAVLQSDGSPPSLVFSNGSWNRTLPLKIFDDSFIESNVCSGLEVDPEHRQNLAELVLGEKGVSLTRALQEIISRDDQLGRNRRAKSDAIPENLRHGLSVDDFCDLDELPDIADRIEGAERDLQAVREQDAVQSTPAFDEVFLPSFDVDGINRVLSTDLPELEAEAESKVKDHIASLTNVDEQWIVNGVRGIENTCPFCGQDITGIDLIRHYRAYFGDEYASLKEEISQEIQAVDNAHSEGARVRFVESIRIAEQRRNFWARFCDVPEIDIETAPILDGWDTAARAVSLALQAKQAAPLEQLHLDCDAVSAIERYAAHKQRVQRINEALAVANDAIQIVKDSSARADRDALEKEISQLYAAKERHSDPVSTLCSDYMQADADKKRAERERAKARRSLDEYRREAFPAMRTTVNGYLERFNTGFHIGEIKPANTRGGPSCTYNVIINNVPVLIGGSNIPADSPSFRNTVSAGDRSTLALALFFASLDQSPALSHTVVVMDDPMSSLDYHRSHATVREIRERISKAKQMIILSHNKRFLCDIWNGVNRDYHNDRLALEIVRRGDESSIQSWDINQDLITDHDRRHAALRAYVDHGEGNKEDIASAIRPQLESYLRVACPTDFQPRTLLGGFLTNCRQKVDTASQILPQSAIDELEQIVEYANQPHHGSDPHTINDTELLGFVRRTLDFTRPRAAAARTVPQSAAGID